MINYTKLDGTSYSYLTEDATRRIFPKGRDGKSIPVTLDKHHLHLRWGDSDTVVTLTKYKYQGRFLYRDSRQKKRSGFNNVVKETQRMLKMSREDAVSFLTAAWKPVAAS